MSNSNDDILSVLPAAIENSVAAHGVTPEAVWMDKHGALAKGARRCDAMFRAVEPGKAFSILDVGCGPGFAIAYLEEKFGSDFSSYLGVDISPPLLAAARQAFPAYAFEQRDIIAELLPQQSYDHVIINGVITAKFGLSHARMEDFAGQLLKAAWSAARHSLSFNVMSTHVDWTRDDLFHWPIDSAMDFCVKNLSRHVNILADYGLYEYTVQVFREPRQETLIPKDWLPRAQP